MIKIWVGKRESDILTYEYFDVSITFWGSNSNLNHSFCTTRRVKDNYNTDFTRFVVNLLLKYIEKNEGKIAIHFYNNAFAFKIIQIAPNIKKYITNLNKQHILDVLRHKTLSRLWLQNTISVPSFCYLSKYECEYEQLINTFPEYDKFVIQKNFSGGGNGTYLMTERSYRDITDQLDEGELFLVSPYYENSKSLSCHIIIDNEKVIVFPVSEQILNYDNHKIAYGGNIYLNNQSLESILVKDAASIIGRRLMAIGYRGICGFDFLIANNKVFLIEINPRYQGSSYVINATLKKEKLPSLFELNNMAFSNHINNCIYEKVNNLNVPYESHTCFYKNNIFISLSQLPQNAHMFYDGFSEAKEYEDGVYLYRYFGTNDK